MCFLLLPFYSPVVNVSDADVGISITNLCLKNNMKVTHVLVFFIMNIVGLSITVLGR